jgi:prepilin-type N-terminal cleavage/methylation domain-containing protein
MAPRGGECREQRNSAGRARGVTGGFTLIELLVVIAVIAVLLAIFLPVARAARERGQRAVCLSNLRQLTMAWIAYADDHDGKLVDGTAFHERVLSDMRGVNRRSLEGWAGPAFAFPDSRAALMANPDKGALWPYLRDIDIYRCPRGWKGHALTYATVVAANHPDTNVEGTYVPGITGWNEELTRFGKRVGDTVLKLTRLTDIVSPGAGRRAVFVDTGCTSADFYVYYLQAKWYTFSPPPIHHADGMTLSMADGHAEYWKWRGRETVAGLPRKLLPVRGVFTGMLDGGDYEPKTEDGLYDLQRLQRTTWGRLGYPAEENT